jgi:threonine dehydrogenase-like Zn-dependent dehydrogenase
VPLQIARQMGADIGILSGRTESPYAVGDRIKSVLGPDGPSVVIDCAGFEATMQVGSPTCFRTRMEHMSIFLGPPVRAPRPSCTLWNLPPPHPAIQQQAACSAPALCFGASESVRDAVVRS